MPDRIDSPDEVRLSAGTFRKAVPLLWGIALCALVTLAAVAIQAAEERLVGHPYIEAIVIAILLGTAIRTLWEPGPRWRAGIAFSAKQLLEIAVALLGASLTFAAIGASGFALVGSVAALVVLSLAVSYGTSRSLGLPVRMSILISCGNSIAVQRCRGGAGDRRQQERCRFVDSFTAVLGVLVVLGLPLLIPLLQLTETQYGILAGMTVYAVPQVLAATVPAGVVSTQIGTLVKLIRVMMLGPLVACIAVFGRSLRGDRSPDASWQEKFFQTVPWFIVAFFVLATFRSLSLLPEAAILPIRKTVGT